MFRKFSAPGSTGKICVVYCSISWKLLTLEEIRKEDGNTANAELQRVSAEPRTGADYLFVYRTDCRQQYPLHQDNTPFMSILLVHMDMLICLQPEKGRGAGRWQNRTNTDNGKRKEKRSTVRCRGRDNS